MQVDDWQMVCICMQLSVICSFELADAWDKFL